MSRIFIELQTKCETAEARRALWEHANRCINTAESAGFRVDFIDERSTSDTAEWTFLVIMITGQGDNTAMARALAEQEVRSLTVLSAHLFQESDSSHVEIDPSDITVTYYRLDRPDSTMIYHTNCNVELRHNTFGIVVRSQSERSRDRNYENALCFLRCRLADKVRTK